MQSNTSKGLVLNYGDLDFVSQRLKYDGVAANGRQPGWGCVMRATSYQMMKYEGLTMGESEKDEMSIYPAPESIPIAR